MIQGFENLIHSLDESLSEIYVNHLYLSTDETGFHQHKKGQLLYAEGGILHIFVEEQHWYLPARYFMWIPAGAKHRILTHSKKVEIFNIYFNPEESEIDFFKTPNIYFTTDLLREMILYTKDWKGEVDQKDLSKYYFLKALKGILPEIDSMRLPMTLLQHPYPSDVKLIQIARFLMDNLETNYTIEEIAKKFGLSTRTLSRKFKENLGINYVRFLRLMRMTKAFELMSEKKHSIYDITVMVGYSSLAAFSNVFLRTTGMRPIEYVKLIHRSDAKENSYLSDN